MQKHSDAIASAEAEMDALLAEGIELERQGKLDESATTKINSRLTEIIDDLDQKRAKQLPDFQVNSTQPPQSLTKRAFQFLFLFSSVGVLIEFTVGQYFIFAYGSQYKALFPWLFGLAIPIFVVVFFRLQKQQPIHRYPTPWVRWLIMFPLVVVTASSLVICSPFGWAALGGWATGINAAPKKAKVLSIGEKRARFGACDQKAMLEIGKVQTSVCIEDRVIGAFPKIGSIVSIHGRSSAFGYFVVEVRATQP